MERYSVIRSIRVIRGPKPNAPEDSNVPAENEPALETSAPQEINDTIFLDHEGNE